MNGVYLIKSNYRYRGTHSEIYLIEGDTGGIPKQCGIPSSLTSCQLLPGSLSISDLYSI